MNDDKQDCPHFWATDPEGENLLYCTNCRLSQTLDQVIQPQPKSAPTNNQTTDQAIEELADWILHEPSYTEAEMMTKIEALIANEVRKAETRAELERKRHIVSEGELRQELNELKNAIHTLVLSSKETPHE